MKSRLVIGVLRWRCCLSQSGIEADRMTGVAGLLSNGDDAVYVMVHYYY